jgi:hypothetical protein
MYMYNNMASTGQRQKQPSNQSESKQTSDSPTRPRRFTDEPDTLSDCIREAQRRLNSSVDIPDEELQEMSSLFQGQIVEFNKMIGVSEDKIEHLETRIGNIQQELYDFMEYKEDFPTEIEELELQFIKAMQDKLKLEEITASLNIKRIQISTMIELINGRLSRSTPEPDEAPTLGGGETKSEQRRPPSPTARPLQPMALQPMGETKSEQRRPSSPTARPLQPMGETKSEQRRPPSPTARPLQPMGDNEEEKDFVEDAWTPEQFERFHNEKKRVEHTLLRIENVERMCELLREDHGDILDAMSVRIYEDIDFPNREPHIVQRYNDLYQQCLDARFEPGCSELAAMKEQLQNGHQVNTREILKRGGEALRHYDVYTALLQSYLPGDDKYSALINSSRIALNIESVILGILKGAGQKIADGEREFRQRLVVDPRDVSSGNTKYEFSRMIKGDFSVLNIDRLKDQQEEIPYHIRDLDDLASNGADKVRTDTEKTFKVATKTSKKKIRARKIEKLKGLFDALQREQDELTDQAIARPDTASSPSEERRKRDERYRKSREARQKQYIFDFLSTMYAFGPDKTLSDLLTSHRIELKMDDAYRQYDDAFREGQRAGKYTEQKSQDGYLLRAVDKIDTLERSAESLAPGMHERQTKSTPWLELPPVRSAATAELWRAGLMAMKLGEKVGEVAPHIIKAFGAVIGEKQERRRIAEIIDEEDFQVEQVQRAHLGQYKSRLSRYVSSAKYKKTAQYKRLRAKAEKANKEIHELVDNFELDGKEDWRDPVTRNAKIKLLQMQVVRKAREASKNIPGGRNNPVIEEVLSGVEQKVEHKHQVYESAAINARYDTIQQWKGTMETVGRELAQIRHNKAQMEQAAEDYKRFETRRAGEKLFGDIALAQAQMEQAAEDYKRFETRKAGEKLFGDLALKQAQLKQAAEDYKRHKTRKDGERLFGDIVLKQAQLKQAAEDFEDYQRQVEASKIINDEYEAREAQRIQDEQKAFEQAFQEHVIDKVIEKNSEILSKIAAFAPPGRPQEEGKPKATVVPKVRPVVEPEGKAEEKTEPAVEPEGKAERPEEKTEEKTEPAVEPEEKTEPAVEPEGKAERPEEKTGEATVAEKLAKVQESAVSEQEIGELLEAAREQLEKTAWKDFVDTGTGEALKFAIGKFVEKISTELLKQGSKIVNIEGLKRSVLVRLTDRIRKMNPDMANVIEELVGKGMFTSTMDGKWTKDGGQFQGRSDDLKMRFKWNNPSERDAYYELLSQAGTLPGMFDPSGKIMEDSRHGFEAFLKYAASQTVTDKATDAAAAAANSILGTGLFRELADGLAYRSIDYIPWITMAADAGITLTAGDIQGALEQKFQAMKGMSPGKYQMYGKMIEIVSDGTVSAAGAADALVDVALKATHSSQTNTNARAIFEVNKCKGGNSLSVGVEGQCNMDGALVAALGVIGIGFESSAEESSEYIIDNLHTATKTLDVAIDAAIKGADAVWLGALLGQGATAVLAVGAAPVTGGTSGAAGAAALAQLEAAKTAASTAGKTLRLLRPFAKVGNAGVTFKHTMAKFDLKASVFKQAARLETVSAVNDLRIARLINSGAPADYIQAAKDFQAGTRVLLRDVGHQARVANQHAESGLANKMWNNQPEPMSGLPFQRRVDNWKAEENVNDIQERLNSEPAFKKAWYAAENWGFGQFGGDRI